MPRCERTKTRSVPVVFRLSEQEAAALHQRAQQQGLTVSALMRRELEAVTRPDNVTDLPLRLVWQGDKYRIVARDWSDGCPTSYGVQKQTAQGWIWGTPEDSHHALGVIGRGIDLAPRGYSSRQVRAAFETSVELYGDAYRDLADK